MHIHKTIKTHIEIFTANGCWPEHQSNNLIRLYGFRSMKTEEKLVFHHFFFNLEIGGQARAHPKRVFNHF